MGNYKSFDEIMKEARLEVKKVIRKIQLDYKTYEPEPVVVDPMIKKTVSRRKNLNE